MYQLGVSEIEWERWVRLVVEPDDSVYLNKVWEWEVISGDVGREEDANPFVFCRTPSAVALVDS